VTKDLDFGSSVPFAHCYNEAKFMSLDTLPPNDWRGFFSPQTPFWNVNRELLLGLAGMRALLMELAHPLIASGVSNHSQFERHPFRRLYRTMQMMARLTFASRPTASRAIRHIHRCHRSVRGNLKQTTGCHPSGTAYRGNDPLLKLWVMATLIDSSLCLYELFVRPLSPSEKHSYYRDSRRLGQLLGIPEGVIPSDFAAFSNYVCEMLEGGTLTVGPDAKKVVEALFTQRVFGKIVRLSSFVSVGMLPEGLRRAYELPWDVNKQQKLLNLAALSRALRPRLPDLICISPYAWFAERRLRAKGRREPPASVPDRARSH
jgi:uncharacterized protein (DUF2236 family)